MPEIKTQDFTAASSQAILDPKLRRALDRVAEGFHVARLDRIEEVTQETWDGWKDQAREIKVHTIEHLDYYLDLLDKNVAAAGGQLHFAKDADEANEIVAHIVRTRDIKVATKSKSMVSEELSLNPVLESLGVEVWDDSSRGVWEFSTELESNVWSFGKMIWLGVTKQREKPGCWV